jgi:1-acyl-sn-glycerol-3-phosphate acyltransferase
MTSLVDEVRARVDRLEIPWNAYGIDPYGVKKKDLVWFFTALGYLYRNYFRMSVYGMHHVPTRGRAMLVGNHSGGFALDGMMVVASCFFELDPPRLAQGMADKFLNRLPFASQVTSRLGHFTGLPEHADRLLHDERLLMVFPEGSRGTAKLYWERYDLITFGTGFLRLALATGAPIVPFGFVGGGDAVPSVYNAYRLGELIGVPYVPLTPYVLPVPLPVRLEVRYGEPIVLEGSGTEDDAFVEEKVELVKMRIAELIQQGKDSLEKGGA